MPLVRKPEGGNTPSTELLNAQTSLQSAAADDRWAAARQLTGKPGQVRALTEALAQEKDLHVREAILTALATDGSPEAIGTIITLIRSPDAAARTAALDALATRPQVVADHAKALLTDADRDVRILSCDLVRRLPTDLATSLLVAVLEREGDINVCGAAIEVLSEVGKVSARPALEACARRFSHDSFLSYAINVALQRIGGNDRTAGASGP